MDPTPEEMNDALAAHLGRLIQTQLGYDIALRKRDEEIARLRAELARHEPPAESEVPAAG